MEFSNPGAALGVGLNQGADFASKVVGAARGRQEYNQKQTAQQAAADATQDVANSVPSDQNPQANAQAHTNFLSSLGQGLSHIGTGINNFFAGGPAAGARPGAAPASGLPAQPGTAPAPGGAPGAVGLPPGGPPVGLPQAPGAPTAGVAPAAPGYMQDGGIVPASSGGAGGVSMMPTPSGAQYLADGGPVSNGMEPRAYLEGGGGVPQPTGLPTPGAALGQGLNAGAQVGQTVTDNARAGQQFQQNQQSQQAAASAIEDFAGHLHGAGLDDNNTPNHNDPTHPAYSQAQNPQQLVAAVAQDPRAQQGLPEKGNSTPHSITTDWWDHNDQMMAHAAAAAAAAGHDPNEVFTSLNHMRTSFVQGHMLRAASAASVALQNGDMKAVEQNLRNMNYYLPDGKDLEVQKDGNGNLVYQNPLQQYVDAQGNPTDAPKGPDGKPNKPNMIPVDQAHIQLLGQAILDPMKVNDTLMATRAAAANQALERAKATAQINESQAKVTEANMKAARLGSQNVLDLSRGEYFRARASAAQFALRNLKNRLDPTVLRGSQAAANYVFDALLGPKKQVQDVDAEGNPNMSPAAGKVIHDSSKIDPTLRGASAQDQAHMGSVAADLYAANAKNGMTAQAAGDVALQVFAQRGKTHPGADGRPQPNAYTHPDGEVGIWDPKMKAYRRYNSMPGTADSIHGTDQANQQYLHILAGSTAPEANGDTEGSSADNEPAQ